jgi:nucleotide-binding universal stress UspA family protein
VVLVGVDDRPGGRDAIALARQLAESRTRLVLANIYWSATAFGTRDPQLRARELLLDVRQDTGVEAETAIHRSRSPARGLHELADLEHADVLVVGSSHRGDVGRVVLGDRTLATLSGAPCAIAIAPQGYASAVHRLQTIGVGHDGSQESQLALDAARELAKLHGAAIQLVSVVGLQDLADDDDVALDFNARTEAAMGRERARLDQIEGVERNVVYGDAGEHLAAMTVELDLLIVGSRSYGPWGRLINGSTSTYLARRAQCPVLVLPRSIGDSKPTVPAAPSRRPRTQQPRSS